jgi:hypothetical protein
MPDSQPSPRRLPKRDLIVLPVLSLLTVLSMWAATETVARWWWPEQENDRCMRYDAVLGYHAQPDCAGRIKAAEGPWVEDDWNECGYRATGSCKIKAAGSARLVVLGSSTSWGYLVSLRESWFARTAAALTDRCGRPTDAQALGGIASLYQNAARLPQVLALHPDVVVMVLSPFDILAVPPGRFDPERVGLPRIKIKTPPKGLALALATLQDWASSSRAVLVAQHFLYQSSNAYVSSYLQSGDKADYLKSPFSTAWRERLAFVDAAVGFIAAKLKAAGVPFALILSPQEAQAELIAARTYPPGIDPYALGAALKDIAIRHGVAFADASLPYTSITDPQNTFYNVNGHFNGSGHAVLASVATSALEHMDGTGGLPLCPKLAAAAR